MDAEDSNINKLIQTIRRSVAVWYGSYAILGAVTAALVPVLLPLVFLHFPDRAIVASAAFAIIILAWPVLSVTGTTITADTTPVSQGEAMGLFNASGAVATVLGTFLGAPLVHFMGYTAVSALGVAGVGVSLVLVGFLRVPGQVEVREQ